MEPGIGSPLPMSAMAVFEVFSDPQAHLALKYAEISAFGRLSETTSYSSIQMTCWLPNAWPTVLESWTVTPAWTSSLGNANCSTSVLAIAPTKSGLNGHPLRTIWIAFLESEEFRGKQQVRSGDGLLSRRSEPGTSNYRLDTITNTTYARSVWV